jgi:hypothetical protein
MGDTAESVRLVSERMVHYLEITSDQSAAVIDSARDMEDEARKCRIAIDDFLDRRRSTWQSRASGMLWGELFMPDMSMGRDQAAKDMRLINLMADTGLRKIR